MMSLDEEVLEAVAKDGIMDYEKWPGVVEPLLERLDHMVHNEFPMPKMPPDLAQTFSSQQSSLPSSYPSQDPSSLTSSNKENAPPSSLQTPPRPPVPPFSESSERIADSQQSVTGPADDTLPPPLLLVLNSIKSTLKSYFASKPPHTIQRLAELVLRPTRHYRTLPAYLRAVDRVVSVSSSADIFPLPQTGFLGDTSLANGLSNGGSSSFMIDNSLGSDESLGGALLTPIPWLSSTGLESGGSDLLDEGSVPVREGGGVTQGELIRQEQEAGVVATSQISMATTESEAAETQISPEAEEEVPHARGPSVLGVEDMGLQDGKGIEMALSNPEATPHAEEAAQKADLSTGDEEAKNTNGDQDGDGDIVLSDDTGKEGQQEAAQEEPSAGIPTTQEAESGNGA